MKTFWSRIVTFAALSTMTIAAQAAEEDVARFYKDKTVKLISAYAAGGNSALYGDVVKKHMGRFLPGNPQIVIQNMPGGAGLTAANYMAKRAARDGTEFALVSRTAPFEPLYDNDRATFDVKELNWIGSANVENSVCIGSTASPVMSLKDATERELIVGSSSPDALDTILPNVTNRLLGTKFKIVGGYPLSNDIMLAIERGEVAGFCGISWAAMKMRYTAFMNEKKVRVLFQFATEKASDLQDIPLVQELAKTPEDRQVFELLLAPQEIGRPFLTAPGVPAERVAALRKAFASAMADPEFQSDALKAGLEVQHVSGEQVEKVLARAYGSSRKAIESMKQILNYK